MTSVKNGFAPRVGRGALRAGIAIALALSVWLLFASFRAGQERAPAPAAPIAVETYRDPSYAAYLASHGWNGKLASAVIRLQEASLAGVPESGAPESGGLEARYSWDFECQAAGFYNLLVEYIPLPGIGGADSGGADSVGANSGGAHIERLLLLDGEVPYAGMRQIVFTRRYDTSGGADIIPVKNGNEIRMRSTEVFEWSGVYLSDSQKRSADPFIIYLSGGPHTLTLEPIKGALLIRRLEFRAADPVPPYAETGFSSLYRYSGEPLTYQAERTGGGVMRVLKSAQSIRSETDYTSVDTAPYHPWQTRLNVIGGSSWRAPGESITWEIEVPQAGLYGLSFRAAQNINRGVTSFRRLYVNGKTPYAEALALGFGFSGAFKQYDFSAAGRFFFFEKGVNTLTLENTLGEFAAPLSAAEESLAALNDLYRRISQVTGLAPDRYIDYEIELKVPGFREILTEQSARLYGVVDALVAIGGEKNSKTALVETMAAQAARLSQDPERVVAELASFKGNISALGDWVISISEMPLSLDSFTLYAPDAPYTPKKRGIFAQAWNGTLRFLATFFVDERRLGESGFKRALKVWAPTGRDQALIIKNMTDDRFEHESGIPAEIQLIPLDVVLPAALSGSGPDMVLDMPQASALNFAVRNALTDLSRFADYAAEASRFYPSALSAATFRSGVYGMPERQWFPMMYIRDDILSELGITPPETWDEFTKTIAELNIHNYDVYVPTGMTVFASMVFQNGGDLYEGRGDDYGISSGLYSEAAMAAFSDFTAFYTAYKTPVQADFANRFRTGEMPVGIYDYTLYNTLELFAPEIRGLWSFWPIPGVIREGSIDNTAVSTTNYTVILESCADKDAAWRFLKWWLSTETQTEYALQLEAALGTAGRYATANREALLALPWPRNAAGALLAQFSHTVGVPEIPGGYMTARMADYAFRSVVTGSSAMRPRQALYMNLLAIDKELAKKRNEFHLSVPGEAAYEPR
ncbi:MAG: extracellular solute-binding protein [Treponema sp.]|jgi:ABC-type glycerol-3-phosphate transport system substrate-binding protein|nr:extracellular solute-binding protein [Treponema sp.]